jgi:dihydroxy-acid dehydratase
MSGNGSTATSLPRPRSATVFDGPDRAHARAYMKGIGFDDDALNRPTIGIANTWTEAMPCNFHLRALAEHVKEGVRAAGATPMEFKTVAISDGVTMGTQGMKASLISREVIADSIELMARGYQFDAIVALCACDKTIPGCAMALARLDVPSVVLYGGSIAPGHWHGRDVTILDIFEAIGAHSAGDMTDEELSELEGAASPGAGACGGQFTANTMACAFEALGVSAGGSAMVPAEDGDKETVAERIGELVVRVLAEDIRPSRVITRLGLRSSARTRIVSSPIFSATLPFSSSSAGTIAEPPGLIPSASKTQAIVLAVNWPPQAPAPGLATPSSSCSSSSLMSPAACAPTASKMSRIVTSRPCQRPGTIEPP